MAVTENLHTGDGSTNLFSFTFPYLAQTDIKVSLNGTDTTAYSLANATQITFNSVPQNNDAIRIYRDTADSGLIAEFFPGSAIRSSDLNNNFTQNLYVTQESDAEAARATTAANAATTAANTATTTANLALDNSRESDGQGGFNTAISVANSATTTANTASATANTASATATAAQTAVADAGFYTPIAALANLPTSPANQDRVEVTNSTGVESNSSVSTVPAGFVGSTNLTVRLQYNSSTSKWVFQQYFASDPESRYAAKSELATTVLELTDAVQAPSSTTISFAAGKYNNQNNLTGGDYFLDTNNTLDYFEFTWVAGNDSTVDTALGNIQVNDQVIINVPTGAPSNGNYTHVGSLYSVRESVTINNVSCYRIKVSFANSATITAGHFVNIFTSVLNITSPRITNGTVALADDSILRYDSTLTQWVARNNADTFAELTDFAYKPNNNTLTFASGSNDQNDPAFYVTGKYRVQGSTNSTPWEFDWAIGNTLIDTQLLGLSAGDAVTIEWPTASSSNGSASVSATVDTVAAYQTSSGYTHYSMKFAGALPSTPNIATSTLTFTSNSISGGTSAITNNQVLRYKTATSKWTVDSITEPDPDTALTDVAQTFTAAQRGEVTTLTSAATITIDFGLSNNFTLTTGHSAILFANPTTEVAGQSGSIFIVQGSTTCAAPTWGNQWYFSGGTAPALTGTTGKIARIDYIVQEAGKIHAVATDNLAITT